MLNGEIPCGDEIHLPAGEVDFFSSAQADFIRTMHGFHRVLHDFVEYEQIL